MAQDKDAFDVARFLELLDDVMRLQKTGVVSLRIHVRDGIPWASSVQSHNPEAIAA